MIRLPVKASKEYEIIIGGGLIGDAGEHIKEAAGGNKAAVVSDSNTGRLYAEQVVSSLESAGYEVCCYGFEAGEQSKNINIYGEILDFLAAGRLDRKDVVIALGGGVPGDMAGFAAATYMRGISYVQIPTTVLAAVDSSVGGKTAIDLPAGKNLAGAFYQPSLVLCDTDALKTLPDRQVNNGFAEVIKYGIIEDADVLDMIGQAEPDMTAIIHRCVTIKRNVVEKDEFEGGYRKILNFGHTIGHAIEKVSEYGMLHGEAVAIGMAMMTEAAVRRGECTEECLDRLTGALRSYDLPVATDLSRDVLLDAIRSDKKVSGDSISIVVPRDAGICDIRSVSFAELADILDIALEAHA